MTMLIFYLLLAICASFYCSIAEAALLTARPSFIRAAVRRGTPGAKTLREVKQNLEESLAAILTLNTVAHTVGAAGVGAQATKIWGDAYLGVVSGVLTFLILIFSEIIPKSLGAAHWPTLAPVLAPTILWLTRILRPIVWASEKIVAVFARKKKVSVFSREELTAMAEIGMKAGHIDKRELQIVGNLLKLEEISVRDIMTPRPVIFRVPLDMTVDQYLAQHRDSPFSRVLLYGETRDEMDHYAIKRDILMHKVDDLGDTPLSELSRPLVAVIEEATVAMAFEQLVEEQSHIAVVVDEYGSVEGVLTMEDVVETLIGLEITDEFDSAEDLREVARQRWTKRRQAQGLPVSSDPSESD